MYVTGFHEQVWYIQYILPHISGGLFRAGHRQAGRQGSRFHSNVHQRDAVGPIPTHVEREELGWFPTTVFTRARWT